MNHDFMFKFTFPQKAVSFTGLLSYLQSSKSKTFKTSEFSTLIDDGHRIPKEVSITVLILK